MIIDKAPPLKSKRVRGRPKPEHVAALEGELLDVALREFLQHGYGGASMARIVKVAAISKTTLYSRYASKDELFRAIIAQQIDQISPSAILQANSRQLDLEKGLKAYANHTLEHSLQGAVLGVNRLIYSESHRFPELGIAAAEKSELGIKRISQFIQDCAKADGIPCKDPKSVAQVFIFTLRGWYVDVLLMNRNVSTSMREQWVKRAVHTLLADRRDW